MKLKLRGPPGQKPPDLDGALRHLSEARRVVLGVAHKSEGKYRTLFFAASSAIDSAFELVHLAMKESK